MKNTSLLQHLVLISFLDESTSKEIAAVKQAAESLKKIPGVTALQFAENVSPEGLDKGYTHCLTMSFADEKVRDEVYLPHPFIKILWLFLCQKQKQYWSLIIGNKIAE